MPQHDDSPRPMGRSGRPAMTWPRSAACALLVASLACSGDATGSGACASGTAFEGSICLDLSAAGGLAGHRALIEAEVARTLDAVRPLLGVTDLTVSIIAAPDRVIPEVGLGGFNPDANEVRIYGDPAWPELEAVLRAELFPMLAHEIHHAMRRRAVGYGSTLFQAAVTEGLADHFSIEVSGRAPPPWALALSEEQLARWLPEVVARASGSYDHADWFFGSTTIPRWTGYAVGFALVGDYLDRNPSARASSLVDEPAASFVPPVSTARGSARSRARGGRGAGPAAGSRGRGPAGRGGRSGR